MKQANVILSLSKGHQVRLKNVTPIEALLLVAEHNHNVGENPVVVEKDTITEISVDDVKDGKPVKRTRTTDEEISRLKKRYSLKKIKVVLSEIRDLPEDFESATQKGMGISLPSSSLSSTKVV